MKRIIRKGIGKFTPKMWRDMWDLIKTIETDGPALLESSNAGSQFGQDVKIILAKITGYANDVRDTYRDHQYADNAAIRNRWVYAWHQVAPDPSLSARFVDMGDADYGSDLQDTRFQHWGKTSGTSIGLGPAYNLMEQNNRSGTPNLAIDSATQSAPGFPHQVPGRWQIPTPTGHLADAFQEPREWSVLPIQGSPIVVMYLIRGDASKQYDHEGTEVDTDVHNIRPAFFLTNALGRLHYRDGSRGNSCVGWS